MQIGNLGGHFTSQGIQETKSGYKGKTNATHDLLQKNQFRVGRQIYGHNINNMNASEYHYPA